MDPRNSSLITRAFLALLIVLVAIPGNGMPEEATAQSSDQLGSGDPLVCGHFLEQGHAQAVFVAAGGLEGNDEYGLDNERPEGDEQACNAADLGTRDPLATCANFREQAHAQALLNEAGPDVYDLDVVDDQACGGGITIPPPVAAPAPVTSSSGCISGIVAELSHAIACSGGADEGFADTFPDVDAVFTAGAEGGSDIAADIVDVVSGIPAIGMFQTQSQPGTADSETRAVEREQKSRKAKAKAKKKRKAKRAKQRAAKLERLKAEHRSQR